MGSVRPARLVSNDEIREQGNNLRIPLYVRSGNGKTEGGGAEAPVSLNQGIADWQESSQALRTSMDKMFEAIKDSTRP